MRRALFPHLRGSNGDSHLRARPSTYFLFHPHAHVFTVAQPPRPSEGPSTSRPNAGAGSTSAYSASSNSAAANSAQYAGLSPLQRQIITFLVSQPKTEEGIHVGAIARHIASISSGGPLNADGIRWGSPQQFILATSPNHPYMRIAKRWMNSVTRVTCTRPSTTPISLYPSELAIAPVYCCIRSCYVVRSPSLIKVPVCHVLKPKLSRRCATAAVEYLTVTLLHVIFRLIDKRFPEDPDLQHALTDSRHDRVPNHRQPSAASGSCTCSNMY